MLILLEIKSKDVYFMWSVLISKSRGDKIRELRDEKSGEENINSSKDSTSQECAIWCVAKKDKQVMSPVRW